MSKTFKSNDVVIVAENETYLRPVKNNAAKHQSKQQKVRRQGNKRQRMYEAMNEIQ